MGPPGSPDTPSTPRPVPGGNSALLLRLAESERSRSAELASVIEAIGDGVVVCRPGGVIRHMNRAAARLLGDAGRSGRTVVDLVRDRYVPEGEPFSLDPVRRPQRLWSAADADRWVEIAVHPVRPVGAAPASDQAIVLTIRDISDARRRDVMRESLVGMLSHQLKTPATTIFGGSMLLARPGSTVDEATRRSVLEDIAGEAERLLRLVDDVVAMTRFGDDRETLRGEPVLLQRILPEVVRAEAARWPDVRFETEIADALPTIEGDAAYICHVLRNLLENAAQYGGVPGPVRIEAAVGRDEVLVRVLDTGPGVEPGREHRLFELFPRPARTAGVAPGAGIGLFVCARLVRAMGGRIWARDRAEGGAEFGFALRVMPDA